MPRDHRRLRVFEEAHGLVLDIYRSTANFPREEWFGIRMQMRRAAVSIPSNIVEGNARRTTSEYLNFLNISRASAGEVEYLVTLARELGLLREAIANELLDKSGKTIAQLTRLIQRMEELRNAESCGHA